MLIQCVNVTLYPLSFKVIPVCYSLILFLKCLHLPTLSVVTAATREGVQIPWSWSYRELWDKGNGLTICIIVLWISWAKRQKTPIFICVNWTVLRMETPGTGAMAQQLRTKAVFQRWESNVSPLRKQSLSLFSRPVCFLFFRFILCVWVFHYMYMHHVHSWCSCMPERSNRLPG